MNDTLSKVCQEIMIKCATRTLSHNDSLYISYCRHRSQRSAAPNLWAQPIYLPKPKCFALIAFIINSSRNALPTIAIFLLIRIQARFAPVAPIKNPTFTNSSVCGLRTIPTEQHWMPHLVLSFYNSLLPERSRDGNILTFPSTERTGRPVAGTGSPRPSPPS